MKFVNVIVTYTYDAMNYTDFSIAGVYKTEELAKLALKKMAEEGGFAVRPDGLQAERSDSPDTAVMVIEQHTVTETV